jgi:hypothetical protein
MGQKWYQSKAYDLGLCYSIVKLLIKTVTSNTRSPIYNKKLFITYLTDFFNVARNKTSHCQKIFFINNRKNIANGDKPITILYKKILTQCIVATHNHFQIFSPRTARIICGTLNPVARFVALWHFKQKHLELFTVKFSKLILEVYKPCTFRKGLN